MHHEDRHRHRVCHRALLRPLPYRGSRSSHPERGPGRPRGEAHAQSSRPCPVPTCRQLHRFRQERTRSESGPLSPRSILPFPVFTRTALLVRSHCFSQTLYMSHHLPRGISGSSAPLREPDPQAASPFAQRIMLQSRSGKRNSHVDFQDASYVTLDGISLEGNTRMNVHTVREHCLRLE